MKYETKFDFKQRVYLIDCDSHAVRKDCECCEAGHLKGKNGKEFLCQECSGWGTFIEKYVKKYEVIGPYTIGQIRIQHTIKNEEHFEFDGKIQSRDGNGKTNHGPMDEEFEENYMCYESGVGSGTIHRVDTLFATKEEAEVDAKNKNNGENNGE